MDGKLVSDSPLRDEEKGDELKARSPLAYTDTFERLFPYYIAIGMTQEQYWDRDCNLVKFYRKADEIRQERLNQQLWLQGMYVYQAIADVAPVLHAFAKKGTKIHPYSARPYALTEKQKEKQQISEEKKNYEHTKEHMIRFMKEHNARFKQREGGDENARNSVGNTGD